MKKPIEIPNDFIEFIAICNKHQLKYMVIGGFAVSIHGYPRSTKDMDICIQLSDENAEKMLLVLKEFGFSSLNLTKADFLVPHYFTQLGYEPVRIDIMNDIAGVDFELAWHKKKVVNMNNVDFNFIGYNELLILKQLAGRPQDLADLHKLKQRNKI